MMANKTLLLNLFHLNSSDKVGIFLPEEDSNINVTIPTWMKIAGSGIYLMSFPSILVTLAFVCYEFQGLAGKFRTIINQHVSWIYLLVVNYILMSVSIDVVRLLYGPLNDKVCQANNVLKIMFPMAFIILCNAIAFWKFMFILVWKSYRTIQDSFLTFITVTSTLMMTFLFSSAHVFGPGQNPKSISICTGTLLPKSAQNGFINLGLVFMTGIVIYLALLVPVWMKRRQINVKENQRGTKNLASHKGNIILLALIASGGLAISKMVSQSEHQIYFYFYIQFMIPFMAVTAIAIRILKKHGNDINKELFNGYFNLF